MQDAPVQDAPTFEEPDPADSLLREQVRGACEAVRGDVAVRPWVAFVERLLARFEAATAPAVRGALAGKILAALPKLLAPAPVSSPGDRGRVQDTRRLQEALQAEGIFLGDEVSPTVLARELYEQARAALVSARDLAQALTPTDDDAGPYNAAALAAEALREASRLSAIYVRAVLAQLDLYRVLNVLPPAPEPKALKGPGRAQKTAKKTAKKKAVDKAKSLKAQMRPGAKR